METIDFIENKHEGDFHLSGIYLLKSIKHFGLGVLVLAQKFHKRVIKRYPLVIITIVITISTMISLVQIGKARAERDNLSKELYIANQKIEKMCGINKR